jgi:chemotaxis protein MotB
VVGLAASDLLDKKNALAPVNRRISITVLTHEAESRLLGTPRIEGPDAVKAIAEQVATHERDKTVASAGKVATAATAAD